MKHVSATQNPMTAKRLPVLSGVIGALLLGGVVFLSGCGSTDAQSIYEEKCGSCHSLSTIDNASYTGDEWDSVVKRMQDMSTNISDGDAEKITEYLKTK